MRLSTLASLGTLAVLLAGSLALAQPNRPSGFSNGLAPGAGGAPASSGRGGTGNAIHPGSGGPIGAKPPGTKPIGPPPVASRPAPPPVPHPQHNRTVIVPVPVYYGGSYYGGDGNAYAQQPAPAYDYGLADAAPGQSPVVIVNQGYRPEYANPIMRDYSNADLPPAPDAQATIYLVAMADHTIIPAIAYWVDVDILSYITTEGSQNRVSLSLIDREFSYKLNDSRNVEFKLPPAAK